MNELKAVFWDVDGTLADTEMYGHRIAFNLAFKSFNLDWHWKATTYARLLKVSGGLNRIIHFANNLNIPIDIDFIKRIYKQKQIFYRNIVEQGQIPIRTGVIRLVNELKGLNIEQWIVTTSNRKSLFPLLESHFLEQRSFFRGYITHEDVDKHKPDPSAYKMALAKSDLDEKYCIVIEDSDIGSRAAKSAGLNCLVTCSPWMDHKEAMNIDANSIVNHLGDDNHICKILKGPECESNLVDVNYLKFLININNYND